MSRIWKICLFLAFLGGGEGGKIFWGLTNRFSTNPEKIVNVRECAPSKIGFLWIGFSWDVFIVSEIANRWRRKCSFQRNMTAHFYIYIESNCFLCGFYSLVIIFLFDKLALTSFSYISKMIYQTYHTIQCTMQKKDDKQRFLIQQMLKAF